MTFAAVVLAHQGGWDEILMVVAPIGLFVVLLHVASSRAATAEDRDPSEPSATGDDPRPEDHR